jgi:hypothetical protein
MVMKAFTNKLFVVRLPFLGQLPHFTGESSGLILLRMLRLAGENQIHAFRRVPSNGGDSCRRFSTAHLQAMSKRTPIAEQSE